MRGFFSGVMIGGLLSAAGLAVLSVMAPPAPPPDLAQGVPAPPVLPGGSGLAPPDTAIGVDADLALAPPVDPAAPLVDRAADPMPQPAEAAAPAIDGAGPVRPRQPDVTEPLAPPPGPNAQSLGDAPKSAMRPFPPPSGDPGADAVVNERVLPQIKDAVGGVDPLPGDARPEVEIGLPPAQVAGPARIAPPAADTRPAPDTARATPAAAGTEEEPAALPDGEAQVQPAPQPQPGRARIAALPQAGTDQDSAARPSIGTPVGSLTERRRADAEPVDTPPDQPIVAYAAPFEQEAGQPLMAIVLIDAPGATGAEALADFPYPVGVAIDPTLPGAAERAARYRAEGLEVIALIDLPRAATAQDAEVLLSAGLDRLPETVALIEGTGSGIQGNRAMSRQVTDVARATGRGLITQPAGLNTLQKLALRDGVPSAVVFRDIDGADPSERAIRQVLDRAAFRAAQEGGVVVLGRVRPETISALVLWGLQDRAGRVKVAPVSAVLRRSLQDD